MLRVEDIGNKAQVAGLEPGKVVRTASMEHVGGNMLGGLRERICFQTDERRKFVFAWGKNVIIEFERQSLTE